MTEARKTFHQELDAIRDEVVQMAATVCEVIQRGTDALLAHDVDAAQAIIAADDELDALTADIEDRCFHQLALQQPMATDLRRLVTAIRLSSEVERSGDLVVNVAKGMLRMSGPVSDPAIRGLVQSMSDEAVRLYRSALEAYAHDDAETGLALREMDDALDDLHRSFIQRVLEACRAGDLDIQAAVQLALIGRYYERIGDHAVNIGERVCFLVTGETPAPPADAAAADGPA